MNVTDPTEQKRVYDLIWSQMPELQKRTSSSWWFFILFPKGPEGYGPKQIMYSVATRAGEKVGVNGVWLPGLDLKRPIEGGVDRFSTLTTGWVHDGEQVHEQVVNQPAIAEMSLPEQYLETWATAEDGQRYGGEIRAGKSRPMSLDAHFRGPGGEARFTTWGELNTVDTSPHLSIDFDNHFVGTHFIAWRIVNFEGEFSWPGGSEQLSGLGYFQRVCLNVPTFPWKWIWALFEDGTLFSAYVPYVGLNLFRKGYSLFSREWMESKTISIAPGAFWDPAGTEERFLFDSSRITPVYTDGPHPSFAVRASRKNGDHVSFLAAPYGHARSWQDRPVLGGRLETHWSYNEYMFRMENLAGRIGDKEISPKTMGNGFGSLEYTYGLGL